MPASYAGAIKKAPPLDREEEKELARRAGAGDAAAANRLVASHLAYVIKIARGYRKTGLPMSDLVQEGMVGLMRAIKRFNPDRDARLATYAVWWIRASIQDHVVRSWSMVRLSTTSAQKSLFLQLRRLTAGLIEGADALGDDLTTKLAERFDTTKADVVALARRVTSRDQSLNASLSDDSRETWLDNLASETPTVEETLADEGERKLLGDLLTRALEMLPDRERFIIRQRYFEEAKQTFSALGRELDLSKDRVRQLEARALASLKEFLEPALRARKSL